MTYLFPAKHDSIREPYDMFINRLLPAARKSILVIDTAPPVNVLMALFHDAPQGISRRVLLDLDSLLDPEIVQTALTLQENKAVVRKSGSGIRSIENLDASLYIVDDRVLVISGKKATPFPFGILLNEQDAYPVIEYWENIWNKSKRVTEHRIQRICQTILYRAGKGNWNPKNTIELVNMQGAFIDVHVKFFQGYKKQTVKFSLPESSSTHSTGTVIWHPVASRHFKIFKRLANRIYALKNRSYLIQTPIGPFLLNGDLPRWQHEFEERSNALKTEITAYTDGHFDEIKAEALKQLKASLKRTLNKKKEYTHLLPVNFESEVMDSIVQNQAINYPDKDMLADSTSAIFVRFGLHPDALKDEKLMVILNRISLQLELI
ncbi:hypothetical protein JW979_06475 [bacterium]|nr:hypothetical protein [candidate division CSSED10-310 bacterium]